MAGKESDVVNRILLDTSPLGVRLWKNTRGMFLTLDGKRKVQAGLQAPGSSDLVGFTPVVITQQHVGSTLAILTVIEVKTDTGRASDNQKHFIQFILDNGGYAGIARSPEDAKKIVGKIIEQTKFKA